MKRRIKHVSVLGSGIMGSGIAAHFANIGVQVLLLDIVPRELTPDEQAKGLTLESPQVRNRIAQAGFDIGTILSGKGPKNGLRQHPDQRIFIGAHLRDVDFVCHDELYIKWLRR